MQITVRYLTLTLLFISISFSLSAQTLSWTEITSDFDLPDGITVYAGERTSPTAVKAWYAKVKLDSDEYTVEPVITTEGVEEAREFAAREGSYVAVNAGYFSGTSSLSTIINDGIVYARNLTAVTRNNESHPVMRGNVSWTKDTTLRVDWTYHFGSALTDFYRFDSPLGYTENYDSPLPAPTRDEGTEFSDAVMSVGGGPTMIRDSTITVTWAEELFDSASGVDPNGPQPRTAIGYTEDQSIILMVVDGRGASGSEGLSVPDVATEMLALGVEGAINLDGGGSSQITVTDQQLNKLWRGEPQTTRDVPSFVAVLPNSSGGDGGETSEIILDTDSSEVTSIVGNWNETANSGFYGTSPSIYAPTGNGDMTVSYYPGLENKKYEVFGWWVASSNRSTTTPYVIAHSNGIDTVRANQSINGSQWVSLGEFTFSGTESDSVVISNASPDADTFVIADGLRFKPVIDTSVEPDLSARPESFTILGNYPNPFNPATSIHFQTAGTARVGIQIYNVMGQQVAELSPRNYGSGTHTRVWNASDQASGIYFYRVTADQQSTTFTETGSMTLIK